MKVYDTGCNKEYRPVYVHDITDISNNNHFYSKLFSKWKYCVMYVICTSMSVCLSDCPPTPLSHCISLSLVVFLSLYLSPSPFSLVVSLSLSIPPSPTHSLSLYLSPPHSLCISLPILSLFVVSLFLPLSLPLYLSPSPSLSIYRVCYFVLKNSCNLDFLFIKLAFHILETERVQWLIQNT